MPDFQNNITKFNGKIPRHEAEKWLRSLKGIAKLHEWPDNFKLEAARASMIGPAKDWFYSKEIESWPEFEKYFQRTYVGEKDIGTKWKEMIARTQQKGEDTEDYLQGKLRMCKGLKLPFRDTKLQVVEGLWSKELCQHLLGMNLDDEDELRDAIEEFLSIDDVIGIEIKLLIVPDAAQIYNVIIGRSWLDQPHIAFYSIGGLLKFGYREQDPFKQLEMEKPPESSLTICREELTVDPNIMNVIEVEEAGNEIFCSMIKNESETSCILKKGTNLGQSVIIKDDSNSLIPRELDLNRKINEHESNIGSKISMDQKEELSNLLNNYTECLVTNTSEIGLTNIMEMDIVEEPGSKPVQLKPYETSFKKRKIVSEIVEGEEVKLRKLNGLKVKGQMEIWSKQESSRSKKEKQFVKDTVMENGILYKVEGGKNLFIAHLNTFRKSLAAKNHYLPGHFDLDRSTGAMKTYRHHWFPRKERYLRRHIDACIQFKLNKERELHGIPPGRRKHCRRGRRIYRGGEKGSESNRYISIIASMKLRQIEDNLNLGWPSVIDFYEFRSIDVLL
ncbi:hypothetical protein O3M35_009782 [Rhynocoris fuscipes]|uniref:Retrotransposon gag domain-containing protein n=1 Tax=Rhynocoris fuscipes TaxID=488301 RepID=A0AAW1D496_9HEMI